jgi:hypothetical protein
MAASKLIKIDFMTESGASFQTCEIKQRKWKTRFTLPRDIPGGNGHAPYFFAAIEFRKRWPVLRAVSS